MTETNKKLSKKEKYDLKREEKARNKDLAAKKKKTKSTAIWSSVIVIIVLSLWGVVRLAGNTNPQEGLAGEFHSSQGIEHIRAPYTNPPYEWSTNPPTSGWHGSSPQPEGFYEETPSIPRMIHSMEHGAVIIWYNSDIPEIERGDLKVFFEENSNAKLLIVPYDDMEENYTLTAWQWLDKFNEYNKDRINKFFKDHHNKGPERAPIG